MAKFFMLSPGSCFSVNFSTTTFFGFFMYWSFSHCLHKLHKNYQTTIGKEKSADIKYSPVVHHVSRHWTVTLVKRLAPASPADRDGRRVPFFHLWRPQQTRYLCYIKKQLIAKTILHGKLANKEGSSLC